MADLEFEKAVNIRTTAKAQRALDRVVASLKASDRIRWRGRSATKEAVVNASWLWLEAMSEEAVEEAMAEFLPRLEALLRGDGGGEERDLTGLAQTIIREANKPKKVERRRRERLPDGAIDRGPAGQKRSKRA
jgi:hypothetical protein